MAEKSNNVSVTTVVIDGNFECIVLLGSSDQTDNVQFLEEEEALQVP